jgi:hypothetical protein
MPTWYAMVAESLVVARGLGWLAAMYVTTPSFEIRVRTCRASAASLGLADAARFSGGSSNRPGSQARTGTSAGWRSSVDPRSCRSLLTHLSRVSAVRTTWTLTPQTFRAPRRAFAPKSPARARGRGSSRPWCCSLAWTMSPSRCEPSACSLTTRRRSSLEIHVTASLSSTPNVSASLLAMEDGPIVLLDQGAQDSGIGPETPC